MSTRLQTSFTPKIADDRDRNYALAALKNEACNVASAQEGNRNNTLNSAALALGHYVGSGCLEESEVFSALTQSARQYGLPEDEIQTTIRSGLTAGKREPKRAPPSESRVDPEVDTTKISAQINAGVTTKNTIVTTENDDYYFNDYNNDQANSLPHHLLDAPGFIHEAMDWAMKAAPYPNRPMIFASVLATLATLTACKIMTNGIA